MPPSGFSGKVVQGALQLVGGCYGDLLKEVRSGKHASFEAAIKHEMRKIEAALSRLHIDDNGDIVMKEPYFYDAERAKT